MAAHKAVGGKKVRYLHAEPVKNRYDLVRAVAHTVKNDRFVCFPQSLPYVTRFDDMHAEILRCFGNMLSLYPKILEK